MRTHILLKLTFLLLFVNFLNAQQPYDCSPNYIQQVMKGIDAGVEVPSIPPPVDTSTQGIPPPPPEGELRHVIYMHGFQGNHESWKRLSTASTDKSVASNFDARKVGGQKIQYTDFQESVKIASDEARGEMVGYSFDNGGYPENYDVLNSIVIAHSQGGIVTRYTDKYYVDNPAERMFGGIATFGTPNQGAPAASRIPAIKNTISQFGRDLAAGPKAELLDKFFIDFLDRTIGVDDIVDSLESNIFDDVLGYFVDIYNKDISDDYREDSEMIQSLNDYRHDPNGHRTAIVPFYGERPVSVNRPIRLDHNVSPEVRNLGDVDVPISWATLHYLIGNVNNYVDNINDEIEYFKAQEYEYGTAANAQLMELEYEANVQSEEQLINEIEKDLESPPWPWEIFEISFLIKELELANRRKDAWNRGARALMMFNKNYLTALGLRYQDTIVEEVDKCVCYDENNQLHEYYPSNIILGCSRFEVGKGMDCTPTTEQEERLVWKVHPSDGLVPTYSSMDIPQRTFRPQKLDKSTHISMRNDEALKGAMEKLYEGGCGLFFYTEKKE